MSGFVKLDSGILDSSIWSESPETKVVWLTMLAMADAEGLVAATAPGLAAQARVSLKATRRAIAIFEAPDPDSRTLDNDGRRAIRVNGGYKLLNYTKYREKDYTAAERSKRYRDRMRARDAERGVTRDITARTQAEAEAEAEAEAKAEAKAEAEAENGNSALSQGDSPTAHSQALDSMYVGGVWVIYCEKRGSALPPPRPTEYALMKRWRDDGIPFRVVATAIRECKGKGARTLNYYAPAVEAEAKRVQRGL